jgi:prophage regulatory protein
MSAFRHPSRQGVLIAVESAFLDKPSAAIFLALSQSAFEQLVREDVAPKPHALSTRRMGWLVRELREWAEARPVSEMLPPLNTGRWGNSPRLKGCLAYGPGALSLWSLCDPLGVLGYQ